MCLPYLCHASCLIASVNVTICAGARTDIEDSSGSTALQVAEKELAKQHDLERKQRYEKVHKDTHTIIYFDIVNGCWKGSCIF